MPAKKSVNYTFIYTKLLTTIGELCYSVERKSKNINVFVEDCANRCLVSKRKSEKYHGN